MRYLLTQARARLGRCFAEQGRYADAETLLSESYRVLTDKLGASDRHTLEARTYLAGLYRSLGKTETEIQERLLERR